MLGRSQVASFLTMPDQNTDAEAALQKLGHRVRLGWAKKHPIPDKSLESVKNTVREQWEQEQTIKRESKPTPSPTKDRKPKPPERDRE